MIIPTSRAANKNCNQHESQYPRPRRANLGRAARTQCSGTGAAARRSMTFRRSSVRHKKKLLKDMKKRLRVARRPADQTAAGLNLSAFELLLPPLYLHTNTSSVRRRHFVWSSSRSGYRSFGAQTSIKPPSLYGTARIGQARTEIAG
ncbi:hypothetical protein EVAR_10160_1 [Eumeta japonica]|uniref:Uncharacterized protein n=1 Tax=Eumeta variegata TaxID=151549 RepID=A0A4C1UCH7_EUMVA|nr:hypothetical protein EVAR_10160_1 [Eumeta japonica]